MHPSLVRGLSAGAPGSLHAYVHATPVPLARHRGRSRRSFQPYSYNFPFQLEATTLMTGRDGQCQALPDGDHIRGLYEHAALTYVLYRTLKKPVAGRIKDRPVERAPLMHTVLFVTVLNVLPDVG